MISFINKIDLLRKRTSVRPLYRASVAGVKEICKYSRTCLALYSTFGETAEIVGKEKIGRQINSEIFSKQANGFTFLIEGEIISLLSSSRIVDG